MVLDTRNEKELLVKKLSEIFPEITTEKIDKVYRVFKTNKTVDEIIDICCEFFGIERGVLTGRSKKREITDARHMTIAAILVHHSVKLKFIGSKFGRDHSTMIHSRDTVKDLCDTDENFRRTFQELNNYILK